MKTKKKISSTTLAIIGVLLLSGAVYAAILHFASDTETSQHTKGEYFDIDLTTEMVSTELIPGDSFAVKPVVRNEASEEIYAFIAVETPIVEDASIYDYTVSEGWVSVESTAAKTVYAYAEGNTMTTVDIDDSTSALTTKMMMKKISNSDFVGLDDINVTITGYGIGTENVGSTPSEAWTYCKQIGNVE